MGLHIMTGRVLRSVLSPCGQTSQEMATFVSIPDSEEEFHAPVRRRRTVAAAALGATALVVLVSALWLIRASLARAGSNARPTMCAVC